MVSIPKFLLEKYDSVEFIDKGAHGWVYKCARAELITAVKVLDALDSESQAGFKREIDILRLVNHPNVVKLVDAGEVDGHYWYESEYATQGHFGEMHAYLFDSDWDRANYLFRVCLGVKALHDLEPPIIHRDIKPQNILVFENPAQHSDSILKIADFGLAAIISDVSGITAAGDFIGTAYYIAPERETNPRIKTTQSDIYSIGITFLKAYTGHTRLNQENVDRISEPLRPIIEKMVRHDPNDRYQSVAEIIQALNGLSFQQLFCGRELEEDELNVGAYHIPIGRELENAVEFLNKCSSDNVLQRLTDLERILDRLGDVYDHQAAVLMNIDRSALELIENADKERLLQLVQRFENAASHTTEKDFYRPSSTSWAFFWANVFDVSSYRPTKFICLEGLANLLNRFDNPRIKERLYHTITRIDDPSYMEELAERLRGIGREDIAVVLDGVPDQRELDSEALKIALRGTNQL
jgi:serine/threonine protein kinase